MRQNAAAPPVGEPPFLLVHRVHLGNLDSASVRQFAAFPIREPRPIVAPMLPKFCFPLCALVVIVVAACPTRSCAATPSGHEVYASACAHCHGKDGEGWPEKNGPTLRDTDWVTGDPDRLIKVTLGGLYLRIPLKNGTHYGVMAGLKHQLGDEEVAAVLTYIRQSWGNRAGAIDVARVTRWRPEAIARALPYVAADFGLKGEPKLGPMGEALEPPSPFAAAGFKTYQLICQNCHQANGLGIVTQDGHGYPPLAGSDYVTGSPRRLIRIVLGGMQGPVVVKGKTFTEVMPPWHSALDDLQVAQVLTFVRQSWTNLAPPINPDLVRQLRPESAKRAGLPWTAAELASLERREADEAAAD